jgi:hypothetical protein
MSSCIRGTDGEWLEKRHPRVLTLLKERRRTLSFPEAYQIAQLKMPSCASSFSVVLCGSVLVFGHAECERRINRQVRPCMRLGSPNASFSGRSRHEATPNFQHVLSTCTPSCRVGSSLGRANCNAHAGAGALSYGSLRCGGILFLRWSQSRSPISTSSAQRAAFFISCLSAILVRVARQIADSGPQLRSLKRLVS